MLMQKNPWTIELLFGVVFLLLSMLTAWLTSYWALSFLIWALVYIIWKWIELYHFYVWYASGSDLKKVPLSSGIWEVLSNKVIKYKKLNKKTLKNNAFLIHQFNTTAQALPYATLLLNSNFEIKWSNQESQKLFGIVEKDLNSKVENIIRSPNFIKILGKTDEVNDVKIDNPTDSSKKIQIRLIKLSNKRYLLVARDISEQESLRKSRKAFVANASHELRTPLTVISGYLEMLNSANDLDEIWKQPIHQAQNQAVRMEKIIDDMLRLSSMEHGRYLERDNSKADVPKLLNSVFNQVKTSTYAEKHALKANINSELTIDVDTEEITSLALNLLNNAIIHTPAGSTVSLEWFAEGTQALLNVCDNGQGIEEKHITHLTERFYRVDNSKDKNTNSTGLGLAIVKQICDNHNATLTITSEINKGSCFKVYFPIFS